MNIKKAILFNAINKSDGADVSGVTATAGDVASGKVFVDSTGAEVTGNNTANEDFVKIIQRTGSNITIPYGTTVIGDYAFAYWTILETVVFPETVVYLHQRAFYGCTGLSLAALPSSLTGSIPTSCFEDCRNLTLTALPSGITRIEMYAFEDCRNLALTALPSGITSIGQYSFNRCPNIAITEIPAGVSEVQTQAFANCTGLAEITFKGKPRYGISSTAFNGCTNLITIRVPWSEGEVANAPWGATNATIVYNYT